MRLTAFCLSTIFTVVGMYVADQGVWASAGGIWVLAILIAIYSGFNSMERPNVTSNSYVSSDGRLPESKDAPRLKRARMPPPPPKKPANPFKIGDRVLVKCVRMDGDVSAVCDSWVKVSDIGGTSTSCWYESEECELISKEQKFKVGDRVRVKAPQGGALGTIEGVYDQGIVVVNYDPIPPGFLGATVQAHESFLELICEKQS